MKEMKQSFRFMPPDSSLVFTLAKTKIRPLILNWFSFLQDSRLSKCSTYNKCFTDLAQSNEANLKFDFVASNFESFITKVPLSLGELYEGNINFKKIWYLVSVGKLLDPNKIIQKDSGFILLFDTWTQYSTCTIKNNYFFFPNDF